MYFTHNEAVKDADNNGHVDDTAGDDDSSMNSSVDDNSIAAAAVVVGFDDVRIGFTTAAAHVDATAASSPSSLVLFLLF